MIRRYLFQLLFISSAAPHVIELPLWVSVIAFLLWALSFAAELGASTRLPRPLVLVGSLILPALVFWQFKTLLGPEASTSLFIMLVALKLHELNTRRDQMVFLILVTLVVMYWLLFSQTILTTLYMLAMLAGVGAGLIAVHSPTRRVADIWRAMPRVAWVDLVLVVPLFLALFFLFPRFSTPFSRFMQNPSQQTGFSGELRPGDMADLVKSDEVAFRAIFPNEERIAARQLYWRGQTLTVNEGLTWKKRRAFMPAPVMKFDDDQPSYELILEPRFNRTLFLLEPYGTARFKDASIYNQIVEFPDDFLETRFALIHRVALEAQTAAKPPRPPVLSARERELMLQFEPAGTEKAQQWLKTLRAEGPEDLIRQVLQHFRREFTYTVTTPTMTSLDEFFFNERAGFCEHFASSFALLMRMAGIPSRVVIGFHGGEYNEYGSYWLVRDRHAHAWAEVWREGQGWVRVDPTAVVNQQRFEWGDMIAAQQDDWAGIGSVAQKIKFLFDALNNEYVLFLLNFNSKYQLELFSFNGRFTLQRWMLTASLLLLLAMMGALSIWWINRRGKADAVETRYRRLLARLAKQGYPRSPREGPLEFALRMSREPIDDHTKTLLLRYVRVRYGPPDPAERDLFLQAD